MHLTNAAGNPQEAAAVHWFTVTGNSGFDPVMGQKPLPGNS